MRVLWLLPPGRSQQRQAQCPTHKRHKRENQSHLDGCSSLYRMAWEHHMRDLFERNRQNHVENGETA
jgi:hypothetical protein